MHRVVVSGVALLMVSVVLAGCVSGDGDDEPVVLPEEPIPSLNETMDEGFVMPPCALQPGTISWPSFAGAPKPAQPVDVTLKTDAYGVTHIYADDLYSLFYANGYVQARDRLFELDVLRLVSRGESALFLGPGQLGSDYQVHRELYTQEELDAMYEAGPAEFKEVLQAYSDGINRFMAEAILRDALPAEFPAILRVPPPWTPEDSVAVIVYLIGRFGVSGGSELSNFATLAQLEAVLGEEAAWQAFGDYAWLDVPEDHYTTIAPEQRLINGCEEPLPSAAHAALQRATIAAAADAITFGLPLGGEPGLDGIGGLIPLGFSEEDEAGYDPTPGRGLLRTFKWGSNMLLVDGTHTTTGQPIMWGAPQMGYFKPPIPYQVGLHGAGYDAAGMGVVGAPSIVIGRNPHMAWTVTSGIDDQVDLIELELTGPRSYLWDGGAKDMGCWTVQHQTFPNAVAGAEFPTVYEQEVCRAEGYPVVAINEAAGVAWMRRASTHQEELMGAAKWLNIPLMTSREEVRTLMADFPFTFNFNVADADGVMYLHTGDVPLRADGIDPRLPTPAGSTYAWRGEAYTAQMDTWAVDPVRGYFANWNNAPAVGWRAGDETQLWGPVQRVQMIEHWVQDRLAKTGNALSWQDVAELNWLAATHDSQALPFLPLFIAGAAQHPDLVDIEAALRSWLDVSAPWRDDDGDGLYDDPAHAIWDALLMDLMDRIVADELGDRAPDIQFDPKQHSDPHAADHGGVNADFSILYKALTGDTSHDWCDDVTTEAKETCAQQLVAGLFAVQEALTADYGSADVGTWMMPIHTTRFTAICGCVADEMPMINKGSWVQVVSVAESEKSGSALPPSNNGLITVDELLMVQGLGAEPARLTSELDLYWSGAFKPFPLTEAEVDAVAVSTETLVVLPPP